MNGTGMYEIEDSYCLIIDAWMSAINQSTWKELSKTKRDFKKKSIPISGDFFNFINWFKCVA